MKLPFQYRIGYNPKKSSEEKKGGKARSISPLYINHVDLQLCGLVAPNDAHEVLRREKFYSKINFCENPYQTWSFSPNGQLLSSSSLNGSMSVWTTFEGTQQASIQDQNMYRTIGIFTW